MIIYHIEQNKWLYKYALGVLGYLNRPGVSKVSRGTVFTWTHVLDLLKMVRKSSILF